MSDIFREVDEALQREKAQQFWKDYGPVLVIAVIALILLTGVVSAWRHWDGSQDRKETAELIAAVESPDVAAAMEQAAQDTRDGHRTVALLNAAADHSADKNFAKAADIYAQVAKDGQAPQALRDLSAILHARATLLADPQTDVKPLAERLEAVAGRKDSSFALQARLEAALLYGSGLKDYARALSLLEDFGEESPASLKEKADALRSVYRHEAGPADGAASSDTATPPDTSKD